MLDRHIAAFGLNPLLGYVLGTLAFVAGVYILFHKTDYAAWITAIIPISFLPRLSDRKRNRFLKATFPTNEFRKLRALENFIITSPFIAALLVHGEFLPSILLGIIAALFAVLKINIPTSRSMPTPFYKYPFEFTVGFRKAFPVIGLAYFLTFMSVMHDNFPLGIFSVGVIYFTCLWFYTQPEKKYFVWIFSARPRQFLLNKIKTALVYALILAIPIIITLAISNPADVWMAGMVVFLGSIYLATIILAKYSAYPNEMGIFESIILTAGFAMVPALVVVIPLFYTRAVNKLKQVL